MKIFYDVVIADDFETHYHPLPWPVPVGDPIFITGLEIDFESKTGDNMKDADTALGEYMRKNYPDKEYKIQYWIWPVENEHPPDH